MTSWPTSTWTWYGLRIRFNTLPMGLVFLRPAYRSPHAEFSSISSCFVTFCRSAVSTAASPCATAAPTSMLVPCRGYLLNLLDVSPLVCACIACRFLLLFACALEIASVPLLCELFLLPLSIHTTSLPAVSSSSSRAHGRLCQCPALLVLFPLSNHTTSLPPPPANHSAPRPSRLSAPRPRPGSLPRAPMPSSPPPSNSTRSSPVRLFACAREREGGRAVWSSISLRNHLCGL